METGEDVKSGVTKRLPPMEAVMNTAKNAEMWDGSNAADVCGKWKLFRAFRRPSMLFAAAVIGSNEAKRGQPSASLPNLHVSAFGQNAESQS